MNAQVARLRQMYDQMFAEQGIDPKVGYALLAAAGGSAAIGQTANLIDLATGPTNALNSGELPMNLALMATLPLGGSIAGQYAADGLNRFRNERNFVDSEVAKVKSGLKEYAREHGVEAAQRRFAGAKDAAEVKFRGSTAKRRLAGSVFGGFLGTGAAISKMADETPELQVNPYMV